MQVDFPEFDSLDAAYEDGDGFRQQPAVLLGVVVLRRFDQHLGKGSEGQVLDSLEVICHREVAWRVSVVGI